MSGVPPLKNSAFSFETALDSQADGDVFQTSVTLAAGDVTVSKDGGAFSNITTLPTEISTTGVLTVSLSADEMNADRVTVRFHDQAGDEWKDRLVIIETETVQLSSLALEATLTAIKGAGWSTETLVALDALIDAIKLKTDNLPASPAATSDIPTSEDIADAVWDELLSGHVISGSTGAGLSTAAAGSAGSGAGANEVVITVNDGSNPLDGVEVWVTTDIAGSNTVASGISSVLGTVTVYLDPGTYYVWKQLAGYTFTNPETMVV